MLDREYNTQNIHSTSDLQLRPGTIATRPTRPIPESIQIAATVATAQGLAIPAVFPQALVIPAATAVLDMAPAPKAVNTDQVLPQWDRATPCTLAEPQTSWILA
jgi:hypothetical protein